MSVQIKKNHKIKNISRNIGVMLLKLGTSKVPQAKYKMTPTVLLPWQHNKNFFKLKLEYLWNERRYSKKTKSHSPSHFVSKTGVLLAPRLNKITNISRDILVL